MAKRWDTDLLFDEEESPKIPLWSLIGRVILGITVWFCGAFAIGFIVSAFCMGVYCGVKVVLELMNEGGL